MFFIAQLTFLCSNINSKGNCLLLAAKFGKCNRVHASYLFIASNGNMPG